MLAVKAKFGTKIKKILHTPNKCKKSKKKTRSGVAERVWINR